MRWCRVIGIVRGFLSLLASLFFLRYLMGALHNDKKGGMAFLLRSRLCFLTSTRSRNSWRRKTSERSEGSFAHGERIVIDAHCKQCTMGLCPS